MKERPILFSGEMVRAILDGRKTVTRRVVKNQPSESLYSEMGFDGRPWWNWNGGTKKSPIESSWLVSDKNGATESLAPLCPYGQPGDRLWVRESFVLESNETVDHDHKPPFTDGRPIKWDPWASGENGIWLQAHYAATDPIPELVNEDCPFERCADNGCCQHWSPSIHMPRWASRITLEVTGVRVERVQEITESDAYKEGAPEISCDTHSAITEHPRDDFRHLWDSINAKHGFGWDKNPWVWVVEFKKI